ncbi:MFS transporter [Agromyces archimandritae]|uniref:Putative proline/betaine transporter n=1 Tax=Agromyces archimandritae TaxID=2781962 RepID=A0A975FJT8_9MICO|nr:MFS transporter [Agromyces archimandritae]QTX03340.1 MHS family MFS transporter [Agromyces archimandritae]
MRSTPADAGASTAAAAAATPADASTAPNDSLNTPQMRRILTSSFLGSAIEFYDFMLYATASAVVFSKVFFADLDPAMATFASFGTLAAGYVARPLGGIVFGHFGDRLGRKGVLVTTMLMMGLATTAIGLLPTYAQVGGIAPLLLVVLRLVQGFAVGGEWGGAMLIALEHAPGGKRGFAASFANLGAPAGSLLSASILALFSLLPDDAFFSWGWRVPFLLSIVLVLIGMFVRLKVVESPLFQKFNAEAEDRRVPIVEVFTKSWRNLVLGIMVAMTQLTISGIASVWAVSYAVAQGADKTGVLNSKAFAAIALFLCTIIAARLSDRFGRKPVIAFGIIAAIAFAYPLLLLVESGTTVGFTVAVMVGQGIQGIILGPLAAFLAELFPTSVRFTGSSVAFQGASAIGAGFTPIIASALVASAGIGLLGGVWIGVLVLCLVALFIASEGRKKDLASI